MKAQIEARLEEIGAQFERVDAQFEQVEARFDQVDARFEQLRREVHDGDEETRRFMRILHEDVITRITALGDWINPPGS